MMTGTGSAEQTAEQVAQLAHKALGALETVLAQVDEVYRDLHRHPELSGQETRTAATVARWLTADGCEVTTGIGGTGVLGLLHNGDGPRVLLRADMDALPVQEQTGLPYASTASGIDPKGNAVPIMHACGHDAHTAALLGTARLLAEARALWQGTLMIVAQPSEEVPSGARAMLANGLYERFGRPDVVLGQHIGPFPAGAVSHRGGPIMAGAQMLAVRVFGRGGHGSQPQTTVDPVVLAAHVVTRLQTIVSREVDPSQAAVVTVGVLRAGTKANIIPDEAYLEISTRAFDPQVQEGLREAIARIVRAEAQASWAPREPEITSTGSLPVTYNDPAATARILAAHRVYFGAEQVGELPAPITGSEDFGEFGLPATDAPIPSVFWFVGATNRQQFQAAPGQSVVEKLSRVPSNHSPFFAPDPLPTLRACLKALTVGALTFLPTAAPDE